MAVDISWAPLSSPEMTVRRATVAVALALFAVLATATGASAHALRTSSVPDAGAVLKRGPAAVTITFGEQPDPAVSSIVVLDATGGHHEVGDHPTPVPGNPKSLTTKVKDMADGVYTVSWRNVSEADGHSASGSFNFGVNAIPKAGSTTSTASVSSPSLQSLVSRWLFDAGLLVLIGSAFVALLAMRRDDDNADASAARARAWRRMLVLAAVAWVVAFVGSIMITNASRSAAALGWGDVFGHSLGNQMYQRSGGLLLVGLALIAVPFTTRGSRGQRAVIIAWLVALAVTVLGEVETSHTSATVLHRWFAMLMMSIHLSTAGLWIGGLAAMLVMIGVLLDEDRPRLARRYSTAAGVMIVLVGLSGAQRAYAEVGSWSALFHTEFGRWVLLKIVLFGVLAVLGAVNRFRNVPETRTTARGLLRIGVIELLVAVVVIVATSYLQNLAPSATAQAAATPKPVLVNASDPGTTVRVRLEVSPGYPGFNEFQADIVDYDTKQPVPATAVTMTFRLPSQPDIAQSRLDMKRASDGTWRANGANLSLPGTWSVTMLVQQPTGSVEVPLTIATKATPQKITKSESPGQPTIYTIHVAGDRDIQVYSDSQRAGLYEVHVTFLDSAGNELAIDEANVRANRVGTKKVETLETRSLDRLGHFVADIVSENGGTYRIDTDATTKDGAVISGHVDLPLQASQGS